MSRNALSGDSINRASKSRAEYSGHGKAVGSKGLRASDGDDCIVISNSGESFSIGAPEDGFPDIDINLAWDEDALKTEQNKTGFFGNLFKKAKQSQTVDLDLGCMYELQNGQRGALQAFGELYGAYDVPPFIHHTGDSRTGKNTEEMEKLIINGSKWNEIKRVLIYAYIYKGTADWSKIRPEIDITIPSKEPIAFTLTAHNDELDVCAIALLENIRGSIKFTNQSEHFPGHPAMSRAYGFGLRWEDGEKH